MRHLVKQWEVDLRYFFYILEEVDFITRCCNCCTMADITLFIFLIKKSQGV